MVWLGIKNKNDFLERERAHISSWTKVIIYNNHTWCTSSSFSPAHVSSCSSRECVPWSSRMKQHRFRNFLTRDGPTHRQYYIITGTILSFFYLWRLYQTPHKNRILCLELGMSYKFSSNGEPSYGPGSPATGGASYAVCQFVPLVLQLSGQVSLQLPVQPSSSLRRTGTPTVQKATLVAATFRPLAIGHQW